MCMRTNSLFKGTLLLIILSFALASCVKKSEKAEVTVEPGKEVIKVVIKRYEKVLFNIDKSKMAVELDRIRPQYSFFLGQKPNNDNEIKQLKAYLTDPMIRELYNECNKQYPDLKWLEDIYSDAFSNYREEFPSVRIPEIYTYISGVDPESPVRFADSVLLIGIDNFLGRTSQFYKNIGIPVYQSYIFEKEFIPSTSLILLADRHIADRNNNRTLLDWIIYSGKRQLFVDKLLPDEKDDIKIGYTPEQLKWCWENESKIWAFFVSNKLFYISSNQEIIKYVGEAPFTKGLSDNSPGRVGVWLGWQIVKSYMENNPEISLNDMLKEPDSQKILSGSGYKPKK